MTDEELSFTRDEAGAYCGEVQRCLKAPTLARMFILRSLIGIRKNKKARRREAVTA